MSQVSDNTNRSEDKVLSSPKDIADIAQLHAVIEREMQKPLEEQDEELIDECIQTIAEIKGVRSSFTPEEIDAQIAVVQARAEAEKASAVRQPRRIKTALLAACLVVIMLAGAVTVYAVSPAVREWIQDVLKLDVGASITKDGITYENQGKSVVYPNVDELLATEGLRIFLPSDLPDGIEIERIVRMDINGKQAYSITFNTMDISMRVQIGNAKSFSPSSNREIYTNSVGTFYISNTSDVKKVTGIINEDLYNITIANTMDVKSILDSLKESTT